MLTERPLDATDQALSHAFSWQPQGSNGVAEQFYTRAAQLTNKFHAEKTRALHEALEDARRRSLTAEIARLQAAHLPEDKAAQAAAAESAAAAQDAWIRMRQHVLPGDGAASEEAKWSLVRAQASTRARELAVLEDAARVNGEVDRLTGSLREAMQTLQYRQPIPANLRQLVAQRYVDGGLDGVEGLRRSLLKRLCQDRSRKLATDALRECTAEISWGFQGKDARGCRAKLRAKWPKRTRNVDDALAALTTMARRRHSTKRMAAAKPPSSMSEPSQIQGAARPMVEIHLREHSGRERPDAHKDAREINALMAMWPANDEQRHGPEHRSSLKASSNASNPPSGASVRAESVAAADERDPSEQGSDYDPFRAEPDPDREEPDADKTGQSSDYDPFQAEPHPDRGMLRGWDEEPDVDELRRAWTLAKRPEVLVVTQGSSPARAAAGRPALFLARSETGWTLAHKGAEKHFASGFEALAACLASRGEPRKLAAATRQPSAKAVDKAKRLVMRARLAPTTAELRAAERLPSDPLLRAALAGLRGLLVLRRAPPRLVALHCDLANVAPPGPVEAGAFLKIPAVDPDEPNDLVAVITRHDGARWAPPHFLVGRYHTSTAGAVAAGTKALAQRGLVLDATASAVTRLPYELTPARFLAAVDRHLAPGTPWPEAFYSDLIASWGGARPTLSSASAVRSSRVLRDSSLRSRSRSKSA